MLSVFLCSVPSPRPAGVAWRHAAACLPSLSDLSGVSVAQLHAVRLSNQMWLIRDCPLFSFAKDSLYHRVFFIPEPMEQRVFATEVRLSHQRCSLVCVKAMKPLQSDLYLVPMRANVVFYWQSAEKTHRSGEVWLYCCLKTVCLTGLSFLEVQIINLAWTLPGGAKLHICEAVGAYRCGGSIVKGLLWKTLFIFFYFRTCVLQNGQGIRKTCSWS